jgi:hypothetical protein
MLRSAVYSVTALLLCCGVAVAQDDVPEMITDRPDVTESSQTVPRYYFQLDLSGGAALTNEGDDWFANAGLSFRLPR